MSYVWLSAQECSKNDIVMLTELLKKDPQLQVVLSHDAPGRMERQEVSDSKLTGVLTRLGVRPNLKGYQYLKTAVKLSIKDPEELEGVTKRLYPSIAKKHRSSAGKVEHAIRHAVETAWERGNQEEERMIFGYDAKQGSRPTNSEFITGIVDYMGQIKKPICS